MQGAFRRDGVTRRAVRENAPDARLIVDANEGWTVEHLKRFGDAFAGLRVELIEQPLPAGQDDALFGVECPVPLGADESCHDRGTLDELARRLLVEKYEDAPGSLSGWRRTALPVAVDLA